ncbi:MAG TPA: tetratricopeptide repeat protein [Polyangiaceae bacterium]|nr:tetratricopeptide repeat protein [Polyangiaceae bacterium]
MNLVRALPLATAVVWCCGPRSEVLRAAAPGPATCPVEGCDAAALPVGAAGRPSLGGCASVGDAPCGGLPAERCTEDALAIWGEAKDDRAVACVARMLSEACALDDGRACAYAGRLLIDGRGARRDVERGVGMLVRACDGGVVLACAAGIRSLGDPATARDVSGAVELRARLEIERACYGGQPDACYQAGLEFYSGRDSFPRDRARASGLYARGCDLGEARACNNLGDGLEYASGVGRDLERAAAAYTKACRLGEALGCANLGRLYEWGEGTAGDLPRARALYRDACCSGEGYGCMHGDMLARSAGVPRAGAAALAFWRNRCEHGRDGHACAFVGLLFEDGPDGVPRDESRSMAAMNRACDLGESRACEWVKGRSGD